MPLSPNSQTHQARTSLSTPIPSDIRRKRQRDVENDHSSSDRRIKRQRSATDEHTFCNRSKKQQKTLTQIQFVPRPSQNEYNPDRDELDLIQDNPFSAQKKAAKRFAPKQKSTLTQMDFFAMFPPDLKDESSDSPLNRIDEQQAPEVTDKNRDLQYALQRATPAPQAPSSKFRKRLNSVTKTGSIAKKKRERQKIDPWKVSSSQPEVGLDWTPRETPKRVTSPKSTRKAKAAAAKKIKTLDETTQAFPSQEAFDESCGDPEEPQMKVPITPRKRSRGKACTTKEIIPSSQSPESLPPSTHRSRHLAERSALGDTGRSPLGELSINAVMPESTGSHSAKDKLTNMMRKIDRERSRKTRNAPSPGRIPSRSSPTSSTAELPVYCPRKAESENENQNYSPQSVTGNRIDKGEVMTLPKPSVSPPRLVKQPSKLLVDGWPDMEELLGRPSSRTDGTDTSPPAGTKRAKCAITAHGREAEYPVGMETQLAFDDLEFSTDLSNPATKSDIERDWNHEETDDVEHYNEDEAFSLGSPVNERSPEKPGHPNTPQLRAQRRHQKTSDPMLPPQLTTPRTASGRVLPSTSSTQSPCRSSHYNSSPRHLQSTQLPSLGHQSQISTQETYQLPPPSTFPASSHHRTSSSHPIFTIKDSDSSLPLYEIPLHYLQDSDADDPFDGDLDPTPRHQRSTQHTAEDDHPRIEVNFSPRSSPSPSLPHQSIKQETSVKDESEGEDLTNEESKFDDHERRETPSSSPILKNGIRYLRDSLLESLPGPPPLAHLEKADEEGENLKEITLT